MKRIKYEKVKNRLTKGFEEDREKEAEENALIRAQIQTCTHCEGKEGKRKDCNNCKGSGKFNIGDVVRITLKTLPGKHIGKLSGYNEANGVFKIELIPESDIKDKKEIEAPTQSLKKLCNLCMDKGGYASLRCSKCGKCGQKSESKPVDLTHKEKEDSKNATYEAWQAEVDRNKELRMARKAAKHKLEAAKKKYKRSRRRITMICKSNPKHTITIITNTESDKGIFTKRDMSKARASLKKQNKNGKVIEAFKALCIKCKRSNQEAQQTIVAKERKDKDDIRARAAAKVKQDRIDAKTTRQRTKELRELEKKNEAAEKARLSREAAAKVEPEKKLGESASTKIEVFNFKPKTKRKSKHATSTSKTDSKNWCPQCGQKETNHRSICSICHSFLVTKPTGKETARTGTQKHKNVIMAHTNFYEKSPLPSSPTVKFPDKTSAATKLLRRDLNISEDKRQKLNKRDYQALLSKLKGTNMTYAEGKRRFRATFIKFDRYNQGKAFVLLHAKRAKRWVYINRLHCAETCGTCQEFDYKGHKPRSRCTGKFFPIDYTRRRRLVGESQRRFLTAQELLDARVRRPDSPVMTDLLQKIITESG